MACVLKIAVVLGLFVAALPAIGTFYVVALFAGVVALVISIAGFMRRCEDSLG